jgi:hypothetical protein
LSKNRAKVLNPIEIGCVFFTIFQTSNPPGSGLLKCPGLSRINKVIIVFFKQLAIISFEHEHFTRFANQKPESFQ